MYKLYRTFIIVYQYNFSILLFINLLLDLIYNLLQACVHRKKYNI